MKQQLRHAAEVAKYLVIPAAGFLSPMLIIPSVTHRYGAAGWTSLAVAQSLGVSVAVASEMGWGVVGPQRVAGMDRAKGIELYRLSLTSRVLPVILGMFVAGAAAGMLTRSHTFDAALLAVALAAQGATPSWYFIGVGQPFRIFLSEGLPRLCAALVGGVGIALGAPIAFYAALMLVSVPLAQVIARRFIGWEDARIRRGDWREALSTARSQMVMALGRSASVVYTALPITLVQIFNPGATATFAASERLMRISMQVIGTVPMRLQGWIGSVPAHSDERRSRIQRAVRALRIMGVVAGAGFTVLAPVGAELLFSGRVELPYTVAAMSGLVLCVICWSTAQGLSLVAHQKANAITTAIIPSAVLGLSTIGPLAMLLGPAGAALGEALAEVAGFVIQRWQLGRVGTAARTGDRVT